MSAPGRISHNIEQAAAMVGVSPAVIGRAIRAGHLPARYPTSRPVILQDDLVEWINSLPSESPRKSA